VHLRDTPHSTVLADPARPARILDGLLALLDPATG